ncbi:MAG: antibiotic biosynthesis monooxygenase [Pseudomonadales bacterium]|nr:antibiotic biosynthesis monooxygenase [Pseudomonadales bacterium]
MIIVHGIIPIKSDLREQALELARNMTQFTQKERGCLSYDFYIGLRDPNTLVLFQEWENIELLMAHYQSPQMKGFLKELTKVVNGKVVTRRYAVQNIEEGSEETESSPRVVH